MSLSTEAEVDTDFVASVPFKKWKYGAGLPLKKRHYLLADLSTTSPQGASALEEHDLPNKNLRNEEETMPVSHVSPGLTELSLTPSQLFAAVPKELAFPTEEQSVSESKLAPSAMVHDVSPQTTSLADTGHASNIKHENIRMGDASNIKQENICVGEAMLEEKVEVALQLKISSQDLCAREIVNHGGISNIAPFTSDLLSISKVPSAVHIESPACEEKILSGLTCKSENVAENSNIQISLGESSRLQNEELLSEPCNNTLNNVVCSQKRLELSVSSMKKVSIASEGAGNDRQVNYGSSRVNRSHWDLNTPMDTWNGPVSDSRRKLLMERIVLQPNGRSLGSSSFGSVKKEIVGGSEPGISMTLGKHMIQNESISNLSSLSTLASKELEKSQTLSFSSSIDGENLFLGMNPHLPPNSPCSFGLPTKAVSSMQAAPSRSLSDFGEGSSLTTTVEVIPQIKELNLLRSRTVKSEPVEDSANDSKSKALEAIRHNIPGQGAVKSESLLGNFHLLQSVAFQNVKPEPVDGILNKPDEHTKSSPALCTKVNMQNNTCNHKSPMNIESASSPAASVALFDVTPGSIGSVNNEPFARNKTNSVNASVSELGAASNQHMYTCSTIGDADIKVEYILNKSHEDPQCSDGRYANFSSSLVCTNSTTMSHDADDDFEDGEFREASLINDESITSEYGINNDQDPVEGQCSTSLDNENVACPMQYEKSLSGNKDLTESASFTENKDNTGNMGSISSPVISIEKASTSFVNATDTEKVSMLVTIASNSCGAVEAQRPDSAKKKPVRTSLKISLNESDKGELVSAGMTSDMAHDTSSSHAEDKTSRLQFPPRIDGGRYLEKTGELPARPMRNEGRMKVYHHVERVKNQDQPSGVSGSKPASTRGRFDGSVDSLHDKRTLNRDYISEPYNSVSITRFSGPRSTAIALSSGLDTGKLSRRQRFAYNNVGVRSERKLLNNELLDFSCLPPRRPSPLEIDVEPGSLDMRLCQGSLREVSPDRFLGRSPRQYGPDEPFLRRDRRSISPLQRRGSYRVPGVRTKSPQRLRNCSPGPRPSPRKRSPGRIGRQHHVMREERVRSPSHIFEEMVSGRLRGSPLRQRMLCSPRRRESSRSYVSSRSSRYDQIDLRGRKDEYLESMHADRFHEFAGSDCIDDGGRDTSGRFRHGRAFPSFSDDSDYEDYPYGMDGDRPCRPSPESDVDFHDQIRTRGFEGRIRRGMGYHTPRLRNMEEEEDNPLCNRRWLEPSYNEDRHKRRRF